VGTLKIRWRWGCSEKQGEDWGGQGEGGGGGSSKEEEEGM